MAFALPCCVIVLCYARIYYIVRKTAMKTHAAKSNGSVKLKYNDGATKSDTEAQAKQHMGDLSELVNGETTDSDNQNGDRRRKLLSKTKEEDLKFIDTSVESELAPTLSRLQRKSVQIFTEDQTVSVPSSGTESTDINAIILINHGKISSGNRENGINDYQICTLVDNAAADDSSSISLEQVIS